MTNLLELVLLDAQRPINIQLLLYGTLAVVVIVLVVFTGKKLFRKIFFPVKTERVQVALIDRDNGEAIRNLRSVPGQGQRFLGGSAMGTSMGRSIIDNTYISFYRLDKNRTQLKLKLPSQQAKQFREGDIGMVTYQGEDIISFEKTGNIQQEDQKTVHFKIDDPVKDPKKKR